VVAESLVALNHSELKGLLNFTVHCTSSFAVAVVLPIATSFPNELSIKSFHDKDCILV
jgi:hypothetical protein